MIFSFVGVKSTLSSDRTGKFFEGTTPIFSLLIFAGELAMVYIFHKKIHF